jgi:hypothetical protein
MSDEAHKPDLTALEAGLASLAPAAPAINRDFLFYHAGRTAARQGLGIWPYTTGLMTLLSLGLGWVAMQRSQPLPTPENFEQRIVIVPANKPDDLPSKPDKESTYAPLVTRQHQGDDKMMEDRVRDLRLRDQVLRLGVDTLPSSPKYDSPERRAPLDPLLGMPATALDEPGRNVLKGFN